MPFFNVCHPEVFNTYINTQWFISQTQQNIIMFITVLGQHVSTLTESSSGPSKKIDPYLKCFKTRCGIPNAYILDKTMYQMHVSFCCYSAIGIPKCWNFNRYTRKRLHVQIVVNYKICIEAVKTLQTLQTVRWCCAGKWCLPYVHVVFLTKF